MWLLLTTIGGRPKPMVSITARGNLFTKILSMSKKVLRSVVVMEIYTVGLENVDFNQLFNKYKDHPSMKMWFLLLEICEDYKKEKLKVKKKMNKKMMDYLLEFKVALQYRDKTAELYLNGEFIEVGPSWLKGGLPYDFFDKEVSDKVPFKDDEFIPDHLNDEWNDDIKEFCENEKSLLEKFGSIKCYD